VWLKCPLPNFSQLYDPTQPQKPKKCATKRPLVRSGPVKQAVSVLLAAVVEPGMPLPTQLPAVLQLPLLSTVHVPSGTINAARVYWSNKNTGLAMDQTGEAIITPQGFGDLLLAK